MKRLGIFLPPPPPFNGVPVHRRVTPNIKFAGTHLHTSGDTWVETGTVRVKCETALPLQILCDYLTIMGKEWELEQFVGEREMLWEHKPTGQCFHSFFEFFQTFKSVCMRRYRVPHLGRRRFWSFRQIITTVVASLEINKHLLARTYDPKFALN